MNDFNITEIKAGEFNAKYRKEKGFYKSIQVFDMQDNKIKHSIDARFYETKSRIYCCVWITAIIDKTNKTWYSGSGYAGGYGYDMESASLADALRNAGFKFDNLSGSGRSVSALEALADYVGYKNILTVVAHP